MKAVVLLSGGLDSTVLLADCATNGDECLAVTFDYGQTHHREIGAAKNIAAILGADWQPITFPLTGSALTGHGQIPDTHAETPDATYVPARNIIMLAIAAHIAEQWGAPAILFGANNGDHAGYPDCRPEFVTAIDHAIGLGTRTGISISAPYLSLSKADIVTRGRELNAPLDLTWSCYRSGERPCNACGACISREAAMT